MPTTIRNLDLKQSLELLQQIGEYMPENQRAELVGHIHHMSCSRKSEHYNQQMGQLSAAVQHSQDPFKSTPDSLEDYVAGLDAAKVVLEYLSAQRHMDLFGGNEKAKRIFSAVVAAGIKEVFYNDSRWW